STGLHHYLRRSGRRPRSSGSTMSRTTTFPGGSDRRRSKVALPSDGSPRLSPASSQPRIRVENVVGQTNMKRILKFVLLTGPILSSSDLHGQTEPMVDSGRHGTAREGLLDLLWRYEQTAASEASSSDVRSEALREAEAIRLRLSAEDFRTGDAVELQV